MSSPAPLQPTYTGHIATTHDALILFEACLNGTLNHVARRPHDRERSNLIRSGNVFIYEEHSSGIKRWTDGVPWSPSRILGNFLIYRELEHAFPPGEKKRAMKRDKRSPGITKNTPYSRYPTTPASRPSPSQDNQRHLVGSLTDSYEFKNEGLVKKTISVTVGGVSHHLVSYYTVDDVNAGKFQNPSKDVRFNHCAPRVELTTKQSFRTPLDEAEPLDRLDDGRSSYAPYGYSSRSDYGMTNQSMVGRSMALPNHGLSYYQPSAGYTQSYNTGVYDHLPMHSSASGYSSQYVTAPGIYPAAQRASSDSYDHTGRPRYNSSASSDVSRAMMPTTNQFARRSSDYQQPGSSHSLDSSVKSESTTDSGYASHDYYNSVSRDASSSIAAPSYAANRSLPSLTSTDSRRDEYQTSSIGSNYLGVGMQTGTASKDSMWAVGNLGASHAHYSAAPQPSWAGATS